METSKKESRDNNPNAFALFNKIRYSDFNHYDLLMLLRDFTDNYNIELLKALEHDISFYLFTEKDIKESEYSYQDIDNEILRRKKEGLTIPYRKTKGFSDINSEKKEDNKKFVEYLDVEELLFPFEFINVYSFRNLISKTIANYKPKEKEIETIDLSETIGTEKIIMLHKLGVIDFLRSKEPFNLSTNALASALSGITGQKKSSIQSYINPMISDNVDQKNNPLSSLKTVEKVTQKLISIGFNPHI